MRKRSRFLVIGAGAITIVVGRYAPFVLELGAGLIFGTGVLVAGLTSQWGPSRGIWRPVFGAIESTLAYPILLAAFSGAAAFAQQVLKVRPSADLLDFGADVWVGLIAAAVVSSFLLETVAFTLSGVWISKFLMLLLLAGLATIATSFLANLRWHNYWSFLGVLLPLGESLSFGLIGAQATRPRERASPT